jgi:membrane protease YdiL (CAAX protease family)
MTLARDPRKQRLLGQALQAAFAVGLVAFGVLPDSSPPLATGYGLLLGTAAGAALFSCLAGEMIRAYRIPPARIPLVAFKGSYLAIVSISEEVIWRGWVLGLILAAGWVPALLVSAAGFAILHLPGDRIQALTWLGLGLTFGAAYLLGGLLAAIAAHATYNLLILAATESSRARGGSSIGISPAVGLRKVEAEK